MMNYVCVEEVVDGDECDEESNVSEGSNLKLK